LFQSFFPRPVIFFLSAIIWTIVAVFAWYGFASGLGSSLGFGSTPEGTPPPIGLGFFVTPEFLWFYAYYALFTLVFCGVWKVIAPEQRWYLWSVLGSCLIIFCTYFSVQVSVAINHWRRPFGDLLQTALDNSERQVEAWEFFSLMFTFAQIAAIWMGVYVVTRFFVSHYVFRWRTAMNDYYVSKWNNVRHIEGASQRIQEDTMRFASIAEGLGVAMIDAVMTLIAFLPLLLELSVHVEELPLVGAIPAPLVTAVIFWSLFGTVLLAVVGIKLPGLEFHNQRVEAAYRKELVYGEDYEHRADPLSLEELFRNVRRNYFKLYFHYLYFNIARGFYIQADGMYTYLILIPTIISKRITYGVLQQILTAFNQVANSFQFLVSSWSTIIELMSIYKRLQGFEAAIAQREQEEEIAQN